MKRTRRTLNWITDRKRIMYATLCPLCRWHSQMLLFIVFFFRVDQIFNVQLDSFFIPSDMNGKSFVGIPVPVNGWHQLIRSYKYYYECRSYYVNITHSVRFKQCRFFCTPTPFKHMPWRLLMLHHTQS